MEPRRRHLGAATATTHFLADHRVMLHRAATNAAAALPVWPSANMPDLQEEQASRHPQSPARHRTGSPGRVPGCGTHGLWLPGSLELLHAALAHRRDPELPARD